jgi:hypothetical protein
MSRPKPDWSKYNKTSGHPLYVLCALSCDIDPDSIDLEKDQDALDLVEFRSRLREAEAAITSGELKITKG